MPKVDDVERKNPGKGRANFCFYLLRSRPHLVDDVVLILIEETEALDH
jgi:hypothetical protein